MDEKKKQEVEKLAMFIRACTILPHVSSMILATDLIDAGYRLTPELTAISEQKIKSAMKKDFNNLLVKGFTVTWEAERMVVGAEIDIMDINNLMKLFAHDRSTIEKGGKG